MTKILKNVIDMKTWDNFSYFFFENLPFLPNLYVYKTDSF